MLAFYDERQALHRPLTRIAGGVPAPNPEQPERAIILCNALRSMGIDVVAPSTSADDAIAAIHDAGYLEFLRNGYAAWQALPGTGPELRSSLHPNVYMNRLPEDLLGRAGYYQADASCVLVAGTWEAAYASAMTAVEATGRALQGTEPAYALCRPPGHHAYQDKAGGFCYLNNTAIAAQLAVDRGARVAILDVDVHHGNGTQTIFQERPDVLTVSVHGDPAHLYPFYAGYADERGYGAGEGANHNIPLPLMSGDDVYVDAVGCGLDRIGIFSPDILIVALGLDASASDPFACMNVTRDGFSRIGHAIRRSGASHLLVVQEGGYPSEELGLSLTSFMAGLLDGDDTA